MAVITGECICCTVLYWIYLVRFYPHKVGISTKCTTTPCVAALAIVRTTPDASGSLPLLALFPLTLRYCPSRYGPPACVAAHFDFVCHAWAPLRVFYCM